VSNNKSDTGPHIICYEDISFSNRNEMYLRIRSSKPDERGNTITLIISEQNGSESDICDDPITHACCVPETRKVVKIYCKCTRKVL
jgi:hypothetical protein